MLYKYRAANYERKLKVENQNLKNELEQENEQATKFNTMIDALEEKVTPVWVQKLECELSSVRDELINSRKDLDTQRFTFERHLEAETSLLYSRIDSLEKQNVDEYNSGLSFCYDCIKWGGREPPKTTPDAAPFRDGKS